MPRTKKEIDVAVDADVPVKKTATKRTTKKTTGTRKKKEETPVTKIMEVPANPPSMEIKLDEKGNKVLQIGDDILVLDETDTRCLVGVMERVVDPELGVIPAVTSGCCIMYDKSIIAASVSIGKLNYEGSEFIFVINYMFPEMPGYQTHMFYMTRETLDGFADILRG